MPHMDLLFDLWSALLSRGMYNYLQMEILDKHDFGILLLFQIARFLSKWLEICLQRCVKVENSKSFKHGSKKHNSSGIVISQVGKPC